MSRTRTIFEMGLREYGRTPLLLALLVFLPAYFILTFTYVMPAQPIPVSIPKEGTISVGMKALVAVLMAPIATALIGGAAGLFLMQSARAVDARLSIVGTSISTILLARGGILTVAAVLAALVSTLVLAVTHVPEQIGWFLLATTIIGLLYGTVGALIGLVLNRLAGIYVLMFGPILDMFLAQSPLTETNHVLAPYLPSHYPMQLVFDAAFTHDIVLSHLWLSLEYLGLVTLVTTVAFASTLKLH